MYHIRNLHSSYIQFRTLLTHCAAISLFLTGGAGAESDPAPSTSTSTHPTATTAETTEAHSQVSSVFASCLPVLRARIANLTMAQELIDTALENVSLGLRMESMGIA